MNKEVYSRTEKSIDSWETPNYFFKLKNGDILRVCSICGYHKTFTKDHPAYTELKEKLKK